MFNCFRLVWSYVFHVACTRKRLVCCACSDLASPVMHVPTVQRWACVVDRYTVARGKRAVDKKRDCYLIGGVGGMEPEGAPSIWNTLLSLGFELSSEFTSVILPFPCVWRLSAVWHSLFGHVACRCTENLWGKIEGVGGISRSVQGLFARGDLQRLSEFLIKRNACVRCVKRLWV